MPIVLLTRDVIADIKNQRSGDYLEVTQIDPAEQNIAKLTRLLGQALQVTTSLKVLELIQPSPTLVTLVAHALNRPRCQLESLVLKGLTKKGLSEITRALSHCSPATLSMTHVGIAGTSCQSLMITFAANAYVSQKLSPTQINQMAIVGLPSLYSASSEAPDMRMEAGDCAARQPEVGDHSLSVSSRWGSADSSPLREYTRPSAPFVAEGLEVGEEVTLSLPPTLAWNSQLSLSAQMAAPQLAGTLDEDDTALSVPSLPLANTRLPRYMRWESILSGGMLSGLSTFSVAQVKPLARLASEDRQQATLHERLLSEATGQSSSSDSPKRNLAVTQTSQASCPPASAFTPVAAIESVAGQVSTLIAATVGHTPKHLHRRYFSKVAMHPMS